MAIIVGAVAVTFDLTGSLCEIAYSDSDPTFAAKYKGQPGTAKVLLPSLTYNGCASDLDIAVAAQPLMVPVNPAIALAMTAKINAALG